MAVRPFRFRNLLMLVLVAALLGTLLTGCWNRRELNELAITVGMGIDKSGDQYVVSAQVVDPGEVAARKGATGNRTPVVLYKEQGASVIEAMRKMTTKAPRRIYMAHLRMLVVGEELAREGLAPVLDFFSRGHELRTDFFITIAKDDLAENILKVLTPLEKIPANEMYASLESSQHFWSPTNGVFLDKLMNQLVAEGRNPAITGIHIVGDKTQSGRQSNLSVIEPPGQLQYVGFGVFRLDKLIGWLNDSESKGYNYLVNQVTSAVAHFPCPDGSGRIVLEILRSHTRLTGKKTADGNPKIQVDLRAEGDIAEIACKVDLNDTAVFEQLQRMGEQRLRELMEQAIRKAQKELDDDFLGFGAALNRSYPKDWEKRWKAEWPRLFEHVPVEMKIDYNLRRVGTVTNSFLQQLKE
ncbi:Ger(x)C family spore germination protein [Paenibacillus cymbidii]|uniref:Ger(x)C family spore germination protein n=1 Tax=Paenibacillus cymbidii TaxID=1639034 RepID=UPI00108198E6|nr:Ger(x)C family spore germination protein [Paenibacillus cymbidii]